MLLTTNFVELRVVAGRSRMRTGSPKAVFRQSCCAVALRRTAWSEQSMGAAWAWHGKCESDTAFVPIGHFSRQVQSGKMHFALQSKLGGMRRSIHYHTLRLPVLFERHLSGDLMFF